MSVFSPLALTQTLPFLPLAQGDIDYEVARRGEPDLFAKVWRNRQRKSSSSKTAKWPCRTAKAPSPTTPT